MKSLSIILASIFLLFLTSSVDSEPTYATLGVKAPLLKLSKGNTTIDIQKLRGEYVIVNFWSVENAQSRIDNIRYDRITKNLNNEFNLISINIDTDYQLYSQIIGIDNLERGRQFNSKNVVYGTEHEWHQKNECRAYLINPEGRITGVNPTEKQIREILKTF